MDRNNTARHGSLIFLRLAPLCAALLVLAACGGRSSYHNGTSPDAIETGCLQMTGNGTVIDPSVPGHAGMPEIATGYASKKAIYARNFMAVAANPLATKTACDILSQGGTAVDAAIAAQMVLTLVEPQSSGIGGGAFMLYYDAQSRKIVAYDGRETAPAAATENYLRWISDQDQRTPQPNARVSGRAIGTPGVLHMLDQAHGDYGRMAWAMLFKPAIKIAINGFDISPRMSASIRSSQPGLRRDAKAAAYFLEADGSAKAAGTRLKSPALANTFEKLAAQGIGIFYHGELAQDIVTTSADTRGGITPGLLTLDDLKNYRSKKKEAVCATYRGGYTLCGMPPPSSGGITIAAAMGILEHFDMARHAPTDVDQDGGQPSVMGVHLITEAERLAYADRNKYIADTDFVPLPGGSWQSLLDKNYLAARAKLISPITSMGTAQAGELHPEPLGSDTTAEHGTSHLSIIDQEGNVVVMTTSVEAAFGSWHMTDGGFLLNNQLTDFSATPADSDGSPIANRIAPGKRPRSSMAPTLVFKTDQNGKPGEFVMATGSPGGGAILHYVIKTLVGTLDWGLNAQQAISQITFGSMNDPTTYIGGEHPRVDTRNNGNNDPLVTGLRALGHTVSIAAQPSGLGSIVRTTRNGRPVLEGGADPRREGIVLGDTLGDASER